MTSKIVVLSACASGEEARRIATLLLEKRLAACINVVPGVESVYRWNGAIEQSREFLLIIKSRRDLFPRLSAELTQAHSYDVPEAIALQVVDGSPDYLGWMDRELLEPPITEA